MLHEALTAARDAARDAAIAAARRGDAVAEPDRRGVAGRDDRAVRATIFVARGSRAGRRARRRAPPASSRRRRGDRRSASRAGRRAARRPRRCGSTGSTAHRSPTAIALRARRPRAGVNERRLARPRGSALGPGVLRLRDRRRARGERSAGGFARRSVRREREPSRGQRRLAGRGAASTSRSRTRAQARRPSGFSAVSTGGSTSGSATTRSRSASTCGTGFTASACARPPELAARLLRGSGRCRVGRDRARNARWHFSPRGTCSNALRSATASASGPRSSSRTSRCSPRRRSSSLARRLALTVVGYVASWDHTVGKGVIWNAPRPLRRPERGHAGGSRPLPRRRVAERIVVTGWPQADVFHVGAPARRTTTLLEPTGSTLAGRWSP